MKKLMWVFVVLVMTPFGANAQQLHFLEIDGIPGESLQAGFVDQIEVFNWSQTVANIGGSQVIMPLQFEHRADTSTPLLIEAALLNTDLGEVVLSTIRTGGATAATSFLTVTLQNARVAAVESIGTTGGEGITAEKITLTCSSFSLAYRKQNQQGGLESPITVTGSCQ